MSRFAGVRAPLVVLAALVGLVLPTLITSAAVAAAPATTLTSALTPATVAYGGSATLTGVLTDTATGTPLSGRTIVLEGHPSSTTTFSTLDTTTTNASGGYTFTRTNQTEIFSYRARFAATPTAAGSVSTLRKLTVTAPLTGLVLTPADSTGILNSTRDWTGSTAPSLSGTTISLQRLNGTVWQDENFASVQNDGSFDMSFGLNNTGVQSYRLNVPASSVLGAKIGTPVKITVGSLTISTASLPVARRQTAYSTQLASTFGQAPVHWSVDETLPAGLT
ncbi:MAG: hypothetical protein QOH37_632, partial [Nocardioidaceae bacterium]|nr:hypothetical protein [Nocardioidaceae bacterium]